MRFASGLIVIASSLFACLACGGSGKVAASVNAEEPAGVDAGVEAEKPDAGAAARDGGADAASAEDKKPPAPPPVDPSLVRLALEKTASAGQSSTSGVRFEVVELGPQNFWAAAVVNRGTSPMRVAFDTRTLSFEVEHPVDPKKKWQKPKRTTCKLPAGLIPESAEPALVLELSPGEGMVEAFDPRFYCVPSKEGQALGPGLKITAKLGWTPKKTKVVWRKGKRVEEPVPQVEPFVVEPLEAKPSSAEEDPRVKELVGTTFELNSQYGAAKDAEAEEQPLGIRMARGSDAEDERTATIAVTLRNQSKKAIRVFFRRELLTFEVMGPGGLTTCDPQPDSRAPDRQAFSSLAPGREIAATSRLIELCPDDTFASPGLYLVHGRFTSASDGSQFGFEAFTGTVHSQEPAVVRIRKGERPFSPSLARTEVRVGEAP